jgi:hypothetical protein
MIGSTHLKRLAFFQRPPEKLMSLETSPEDVFRIEFNFGRTFCLKIPSFLGLIAEVFDVNRDFLVFGVVCGMKHFYLQDFKDFTGGFRNVEKM